ncbi:hypothetical protein EMIHUDRAFT_218455 [Emiliania huxleyi CCMP1516]|uniref:Serine aminopeptidase S33 domain-containing protein n=2 Tax=Emiliania huxleyi TaxID=2903 RepID=A0A0D3I8B2_EMIH1|nr:hypothetical protein EMIHUDRAFT_218455 [Emiliania huxleyi CCMP1516]EOD07497.1 hypothetical protein EMIHUDRAFT_218455 [Emiliania huxleyi CCMP1516]|eukprot:XP_005759926.1 hypothetical protein EMIHUDRAFT_218455 [Emiliania huxleyi CCMP1516]
MLCLVPQPTAWSPPHRTHERPRRSPRCSLAAASPRDFAFRRLTPERPELPVLLFLPGIDGTGSAGATQWPRLASSFEVHALSFAPADRSSFGDVLSGCEAFLGDTAAGRGTLLVGESTGAVAALGLAYRAPNAVDGLCLVNPATGYAGSALSTLAPLLTRLPRGVYRAAPYAVTPLFGKRDWFRSIVGEDATTGPPPLLPSPAAVLSASGALADALPAEALAWRLEEHLRKGSAAVNGRLAAGGRAPASSTLLLAGGRDLVLASPAETSRLQQRLPGSVRKLLPSAGHACLDDARSLNLRLELAQSGVLSAGMRRLFSPLFYTVRADGALERGVLGLALPAAGSPVLFVELLRERDRLLRPMVFPPLLASESPLAPLPYPLPGTAATFERFGATKALARGECVLLFPGGAREVFKRKGEQYRLFWGEDADFVPFSGLGGDESFSLALDSDELLSAPLVGDFFRQRVGTLPSFVPGDVFVPPLGALTPQRHYFLFGAPVDLTGVEPSDRETCASVYDEVRAAVVGGVARLKREVRERDGFRDNFKRTAWEAVYDAQAPGPEL